MPHARVPGGTNGRWYWFLLVAAVLLVIVVEELLSDRGGRWAFRAIISLVIAQLLAFLAGYQLRHSRSAAAAQDGRGQAG